MTSIDSYEEYVFLVLEYLNEHFTVTDVRYSYSESIKTYFLHIRFLENYLPMMMTSIQSNVPLSRLENIIGFHVGELKRIENKHNQKFKDYLQCSKMVKNFRFTKN